MTIKFEVIQGIIHVNSISILHCTKRSLCFEADFKQKYAELAACCEGLEFTFIAGEHTLGVTDRKAEATRIQVVGIPKVWSSKRLHTSLSMGRYSAMVFVVVDESAKHDNPVWWATK